MRQQAVAGHRSVDVSGLPDQGAFGSSGLIWWGTVGYMVIEGSMFVMTLITYFYLRLKVDAWPPSLSNPDLFWGTVNLALLLVSVIPNHICPCVNLQDRFWWLEGRSLRPIAVDARGKLS